MCRSNNSEPFRICSICFLVKQTPLYSVQTVRGVPEMSSSPTATASADSDLSVVWNCSLSKVLSHGKILLQYVLTNDTVLNTAVFTSIFSKHPWVSVHTYEVTGTKDCAPSHCSIENIDEVVLVDTYHKQRTPNFSGLSERSTKVPWYWWELIFFKN